MGERLAVIRFCLLFLGVMAHISFASSDKSVCVRTILQEKSAQKSDKAGSSVAKDEMRNEADIIGDLFKSINEVSNVNLEELNRVNNSPPQLAMSSSHMALLELILQVPEQIKKTQLEYQLKDSIQYLFTSNPIGVTVSNPSSGFLSTIRSFIFIASKESMQKMIEIVRNLELGLVQRLIRRVYRGEKQTLTTEFLLLNNKGFKASYNGSNVKPQFLVLQDHHQGHKFVNKSKEPTVEKRHYNLRGVYFPLKEGFWSGELLNYKDGKTYSVAAMEATHENQPRPYVVGTSVGKNIAIVFQGASGKVLPPPNDVLITIKSEGKTIVDSSFLELSDQNLSLLESLEVIKYVDLISKGTELQDHYYY